MQVFTRSVNYCKWSQCCERLLGSLCMYRWHHSMTGNRKQRPRNKQNKKTNSQNTRTKQKQKTGKPKNKNRTPQLGMVYPKAAMRRNDKAACVPSPERVILETNVDTFKLQHLSSHCRSDYFGSTKIVGSNSFGQNKIGHEFCLPKTDSSKFTLYKPTHFAKNLLPVRRQRKVSIPASLVSNNIKPGFHVVVPQLQHPNSQSRRFDEVCTLMQHTIPLEGLISAQDSRTLQSAKSCVQRLHVRVEALANVLEQTLISQQLQFIHIRAQHGRTSNSTFQLGNNPCVAHNEDEPGNTPNGPADKEVRTKTCNHQPGDAKP